MSQAPPSKISLSALEFALVEALPEDFARIARAARRLSDAFTSGRAELPARYLADPNLLAAYLAAFLLPNAEKVLHCLAEADEFGALPAGAPLHVLDLGAGPGTATLAASLFFAQMRPALPVRFTAVEGEEAAARAAERLFSSLAPANHVLASITGDLSSKRFATAIAERRFDLIVAAHVLNELSEDAAAADLCQMLFREHLAEDGAFLIIDPALRDTARPLMQLRDQLLTEGVARVVAPCLHQVRCPMLAANERDWCHFYLDWECPRLVAQMDAISGMRHKHLKMAYLLLTSAANDGGRAEPHLARVVSSPLDSKGKRELVLCGADGALRRVRRMDRDASTENRDVDDVVRGDVVRCGARDRIGKDDAFSRVRLWAP
jgi:ribosomal protein RSM22 (predicted rRNA methylase)